MSHHILFSKNIEERETILAVKKDLDNRIIHGNPGQIFHHL